MTHLTTTKDKQGFRIFLSYAHVDAHYAKEIDTILRGLGHEPLWDRNIRPGTPFTDSIKTLIERAHLFMPIITPQSQDRPWVHQETGYAIALNIPVLPLAIGELPTEMTAALQALRIQENPSDLKEQLEGIDFKKLILPKPVKPHGIMNVAEWPEIRAELMGRYANWVLELGEHGYVRHQGGVSSFSIPDRDVNDTIWKCRDGKTPRSDYFHYLQREERCALERHAREKGCSLIIDPDTPIFNTRGLHARASRLLALMDFISSMTDEKLRIVFSPQPLKDNLIIIGDYFFAESLSGRVGGYYQTLFNSHPPSVLEKLDRFDKRFDSLHRKYGKTVAETQAHIQTILRDLPPKEQCSEFSEPSLDTL